MGLFDKKYCEFCGEKLGVFGKTTLKDGYMCKDCAAKLSHWYSVGKGTSVADIHEHLMYRTENKQKVEDFRVTKSFGENYKVLIDEDASRVMVTAASDFSKSNPDVFELSDITSASYDISENKTELKDKDENGKSISFDPKRYEYKYDFYVTLYVKNPYFSTMKFKVNKSYVYINPFEEGTAAEEAIKEAEEGRPSLSAAGRPSLTRQEDRRPNARHTGIVPPDAAPAPAAQPVDKYKPDVDNNEDYQAYKELCEEIVDYFNAKG